ncbi:GNAT family N-acetyltransferase [Aeromicrobium sp. CTD01-1L150]|uniref:GNAT family N-acetyltransferase n=1 Tax=Aeromicrobium sp. CTD01-1L150 TaxID=3341830 RepID=UPI0035C13D05
MTFTLRPVEPAADAALIHSWVSQERAYFWGMTEKSCDEVRDIYAYLDSLETHHAYLVHDDDAPVAIFQTYQPEHDPVGECYAVQEGDLGVHLFIAAGERRPGFTASLTTYLLGVVFADPAVRRVVGEPDVRNQKSRRRAELVGFEPGPVIDLGHKRAQLSFLQRPQEVSPRGAPPESPGR